jgi:hypothetical protein
MKLTTRASKWALSLLAVASMGLFSTDARAGDIFLTGHDVDLHGGQNGYDKVIVDYLKGSTPAANYKLVVIGTQGVGFASFTGGGNFTGLASGSAINLAGTVLAGYGGATFYDAQAFAAMTPAARAAIYAPLLAGGGALEILSHVNCGGCSLTTAGSNAINSLSAEIASAFNAGMDIYGNSGDGLSTYYNFLPPTALASGTSIGGSSGFTATAAGAAIGITSSMANGFPTHNRFSSQAAAFTVMETRGTEVISIGLQGGTIGGGGEISVPDGGTTVALLGMALSGVAFIRRKLGCVIS